MLTNELASQFTVPVNLKECLNRNEKGDAELFVRMFGKAVAFDHGSKAWNIWRDHYWEEDKKREVLGLVMNQEADVYFREAENLRKQNDKDAEKLATEYSRRAVALRTKHRAENVLYDAGGEPAIALAGDEWDHSPDLLAMKNGVVDLQTGLLQNGRQEDYIRFHVPVDWKGLDCPCPTWEKFIGDIFNWDAEMIAFIQRLFGYATTGHTREHRLPIFWGEEGRNGKTTLFETLRNLLGDDLCISIPTDTLMDTRRSGDSTQPFLYELRGKRLAYASESKDGQKLNLGLIKQLTGGDTLNVRTLYTRPVRFQPTHKIMLLTNHRPTIPADDPATWERILLIPMLMRFVDHPTQPNERQKEDLRDKLRPEASGILTWLVRGNLEWRKQGLNPPASVLVATNEYREEEDTLAQFLAETYDEFKDDERQAKCVYDDYLAWANRNGISLLNRTAFGKRLKLKFQWEERGAMLFSIRGFSKKQE